MLDVPGPRSAAVEHQDRAQHSDIRGRGGAQGRGAQRGLQLPGHETHILGDGSQP